jgi:hypothetical protein
MIQPAITSEMTVFDVLDQVPGAIDLFQQHGVNPTGKCTFFTTQIRFKDTPERCHVVDWDELILKLNAAMHEKDAAGKQSCDSSPV